MKSGISCLKGTLMNSSIESCLTSAQNMSLSLNSTDTVAFFMMANRCVKEARANFKNQVRSGMLDEALGSDGCSFSALIALKLFGNGGEDKDTESLDRMISNELEGDDDEDESPFKWKGRRSSSGRRGSMSEDIRGRRGNFGSRGRRGQNNGGIIFGRRQSGGRGRGGIRFGGRTSGGNNFFGRGSGGVNFGRGNKGGRGQGFNPGRGRDDDYNYNNVDDDDDDKFSILVEVEMM